MIELYNQGISTAELSKRYRFASNVILRHFHRRGVKIRHRKYNFNEKAFESINNEETAYWLGFLMADASVRKERAHYQFSFFLKAEDVECIKAFKKFMKADQPIVTKKNNKGYVEKGIRLNSKKLIHDLAKYGIIPRKSYKERFPENIPNELVHHFMRGVFDGDGHVGINHNEEAFQVGGTREFLIVYQKILAKNCNLNVSSYCLYRDKNTVCSYRLKYGGRLQVLRIYEFLYKDATIWLERKRKDFEKLKNKQLQWVPVDSRIVERMLRLYQAGSSSVDIAKTYNVTHRTVLNHLYKNNIPTRTLSEAQRVKHKPKSFYDSFCCVVKLRSAQSN
ncbi:hypothetical protein J7M02_05090 [Candidatus Aerophobetes bacterium]|nr:hypothetical protein [Candidatus Aerophobetes bacterium]